MAESDLHRRLKRVACRWLWEAGYAAIAEEVHVPGVGIIDVAAAGKWRRYNPRRAEFDRVPAVDRHHVVFVECKAMRADFLRDQGRQEQFSFALAERDQRFRSKRRHTPRHASAALGKFDTCLVRPHAQLHYLLTSPKLLKASEVPRRWGWLTYDGASVRVMRKACWQEVASVDAIEGAIARALTLERMGIGSWMGTGRARYGGHNNVLGRERQRTSADKDRPLHMVSEFASGRTGGSESPDLIQADVAW